MKEISYSIYRLDVNPVMVVTLAKLSLHFKSSIISYFWNPRQLQSEKSQSVLPLCKSGIWFPFYDYNKCKRLPWPYSIRVALRIKNFPTLRFHNIDFLPNHFSALFRMSRGSRNKWNPPYLHHSNKPYVNQQKQLRLAQV